MSQHHYTGTQDGREIHVQMGFDRQLNHVFMTVTEDDIDEGDILYTSMADPRGAFDLGIDDLRDTLADLGIDVPAVMFEQIESDQANRVGNRIVRYNDQGIVEDLNFDRPNQR